MKLIRDKIGERILANEPHVPVRIASESEKHILLVRKLQEELNELMQTGFTDIEEYADVFEVLLALAESRGVSASDIDVARKAKAEKNGCFSKNYILL